MIHNLRTLTSYYPLTWRGVNDWTGKSPNANNGGLPYKLDNAVYSNYVSAAPSDCKKPCRFPMFKGHDGTSHYITYAPGSRTNLTKRWDPVAGSFSMAQWLCHAGTGSGREGNALWSNVSSSGTGGITLRTWSYLVNATGGYFVGPGGYASVQTFPVNDRAHFICTNRLDTPGVPATEKIVSWKNFDNKNPFGAATIPTPATTTWHNNAGGGSGYNHPDWGSDYALWNSGLSDSQISGMRGANGFFQHAFIKNYYHRSYIIPYQTGVGPAGQPTAKRWGGVPHMAINKGVW